MIQWHSELHQYGSHQKELDPFWTILKSCCSNTWCQQTLCVTFDSTTLMWLWLLRACLSQSTAHCDCNGQQDQQAFTQRDTHHIVTVSLKQGKWHFVIALSKLQHISSNSAFKNVKNNIANMRWFIPSVSDFHCAWSISFDTLFIALFCEYCVLDIVFSIKLSFCSFKQYKCFKVSHECV